MTGEDRFLEEAYEDRMSRSFTADPLDYDPVHEADADWAERERERDAYPCPKCGGRGSDDSMWGYCDDCEEGRR